MIHASSAISVPKCSLRQPDAAHCDNDDDDDANDALGDPDLIASEVGPSIDIMHGQGALYRLACSPCCNQLQVPDAPRRSLECPEAAGLDMEVVVAPGFRELDLYRKLFNLWRVPDILIYILYLPHL